MQAISQRFREAIPFSHTVVGRVELINPDGTIIETSYGPTLPAVSGSVRATSTQLVRRTATIELVDLHETLMPEGRADDVLSQYGSEFRVWRGIKYDDGTVDEHCQGTFQVDKIEPAGSNKLTLSGADRGSRALAKFKTPLPIPNLTNGDVAVRAAVIHCYPEASFRASSSLWTVPLQVLDIGTEGLVKAQELATAIGQVVFADVDGYFVIRPAPGLDATISWIFDKELISGPEATSLMDVQRTFEQKGGINGMIIKSVSARGDETGGATGIVAEAWDEDENSPTWRYGRFGERPDTMESDKVTSINQGIDMAKTELQRRLGAADEVTFTAIANGAILESDMVKMNRPDLNLNGTFILTDIDMPIFGGTMSCSAHRWVRSEPNHG